MLQLNYQHAAWEPFCCDVNNLHESFSLMAPRFVRHDVSVQAKPLVLNSIHCNPCRPWQFTVAGGDAYVRVYDRRKAEAASCSGEGDEGDPTASTRSFAAALATPVSTNCISCFPP